MCGIFASHSVAHAFDTSCIDKITAALRHRGPDGEGSWCSSDLRTCLLHTRLSIVDLKNGAQPLENEEKTIFAVVNGEFYNHKKIRASLELHGHRFATQSDSEVLIHLYEEHGVECLKDLRGEFAFILWDAPRKRLFAARDRFGIKPLYYTEKEQSISLASEAKALFAGGAAARWDSESLFQALSLHYVLPHRSLFQGISQLPPGCYLLFEEGISRVKSYWDLSYPASGEKFQGTFEEAKEQISSLFTESVALRLQADVPVCFHLSGGLDSSLIVAAARSLGVQRPECFTVSFPDHPYDELTIAEKSARSFGAHLTAVELRAEDFLQNLDDAALASEGLAANGHYVAKYLLSRKIHAAGFKVALTGEGSDEIFAGYAHLRKDLFVGEGCGSLERLLLRNQASAGLMLPVEGAKSLSLEAAQKALGFVPSFLQAKAEYGFRMRQLLSDDFIAGQNLRDPVSQLLNCVDISSQLTGRHPVYQSLYLWSKQALSNYILRTLGDGMEMAHSIEGRLPFLDHKLFEYVRALPLKFKINEGVEKYILRETFKDSLPHEVYAREKHPFVAPPLFTLASAAQRHELYERLTSREIRQSGIFDAAKVDVFFSSLSEHPDASSLADPVLYTALSVCALHTGMRLSC